MGSPSEPATTGPSIVTLTMNPGPALVLPLRTTDTVAGVLVALRDNGAQPFSDEQLDMMAAFVDEAALAWQLATSQRRMREVDVLTDRDRIARDLHDHVIQRLFAVGLALQGTVRGPFNRSTTTALRFCRRLARRHPGDPNYDLRPARRTRGKYPTAAAAR